MVNKLALEKACDRLEASFVRLVLDHFGFPKNISEIILSCISTTSTFFLMAVNLKPSSPQEALDKETLCLPTSSFSVWNT